ncbi:phosphodiester glycosidase family protein, partial [Streptomyces tricolor]
MRRTRIPGTERRSARLRARLATTIVLALTAPAFLPGAAEADLERPTATEQWTTRTLAPGVTVRTGVLRHPGTRHAWTVTAQAPARTRWTTN